MQLACRLQDGRRRRRWRRPAPLCAVSLRWARYSFRCFLELAHEVCKLPAVAWALPCHGQGCPGLTACFARCGWGAAGNLQSGGLFDPPAAPLLPPSHLQISIRGANCASEPPSPPFEAERPPVTLFRPAMRAIALVALVGRPCRGRSHSAGGRHKRTALPCPSAPLRCLRAPSDPTRACGAACRFWRPPLRAWLPARPSAPPPPGAPAACTAWHVHVHAFEVVCYWEGQSPA